MNEKTTYTYMGKSGLNSGELFFLIFVDETLNQLGGEDVAAAAAMVSGLNIIPTRVKFGGSIPNTSLASMGARRVIGERRTLPLGLRLPTIVGFPPFHMRVRMVRNLGTFVGRTVPVLGWAIAAYDITQISINSVRRYNEMVRPEDRI